MTLSQWTFAKPFTTSGRSLDRSQRMICWRIFSVNFVSGSEQGKKHSLSPFERLREASQRKLESSLFSPL
jgi:hypothetical protein